MKCKMAAAALAVLMMATALPLGAFPQTGTMLAVQAEAGEVTEGDLTFRKYEDHAAVTKCAGEATEVVIPAEIDGVPVTEIGSRAFNECKSLTSVTIPDGVTRIGGSAFYNCTALTSVNIPDSVTSLDYYAFYQCASLAEITIPNGVTRLDSSVFAGCTSLASVTIPGSVKSIASSAFSECTALTSVTIEDGVETIGSSAFFKCTSLTDVTIPDSAVNIEGTAFDGTPWIEAQMEKNPLVLINGCVLKGKNCTGDLVLPEGTRRIGMSAFQNATGLTSITIPDSVEVIGFSAFMGCTSLASVNIPDGVTEIVANTFAGCSSLTSVTIPESVTSIRQGAFEDCSSLVDITIPESVTTVEHRAFYGTAWLAAQQKKDPIVVVNGNLIDATNCTGDITLPDSVKNIVGAAFYYCESLTSVVIPESVENIEMDAFYAFFSDRVTTVTVLNPDCKIYSSDNTLPREATVRGYDGSTAQEYARLYNRKFESLGAKPEKTTEPATEPNPQPATLPATEPKTEPVTEPKTEPKTEPATDPELKVTLYGDVDCSEKVDIVDVIALNKNLMVGEKLTEQGKRNADVDNNNKIEAVDALNILKCVVELVTLPVE